jgi:hypothetical protein
MWTRLARRGLGRTLTRLDPTRRDLPTPCVGYEPVTPEEQQAAVVVVDDRARRFPWHPHDVVVEPAVARHLDVDE